MKTSYAFNVSNVSCVPLSNDGRLEVTCLGTGSMLAPGQANTSFMVVKGKEHLLLDCGRTVPDALRSYGIRLSDIENVFLTHAHGDHVGGFSTLATANRYVGCAIGTRKLNLVAPHVFADTLWANCFCADLGSHDRASDFSHASPESWYDLAEPALMSVDKGNFDRDIYAIDFKGMHLEIFRTMHTPVPAVSWRESAWSTGILIDGKIWISGDSRFDLELLKYYVDKAEVFIHDMSSFPGIGHASPTELNVMPVTFKRRMYSTHHDHGFTPATIAGKGFAGMTTPGMKFTFEKSVTERLVLPVVAAAGTPSSSS